MKVEFIRIRTKLDVSGNIRKFYHTIRHLEEYRCLGWFGPFLHQTIQLKNLDEITLERCNIHTKSMREQQHAHF